MAIDVLIAKSRQRDALSLWYVLERVRESDRDRIFERLAAFIPLPENTTREGVLARNRGMLDAWKETIDVTSVGESFIGKNQNAGNSRKLISVGNMTASRAGHTATRLLNGKILIVGGMQKASVVLSSAEIFDPTNGKFSPTGGMQFARFGHTATLLPGGLVLIVGGTDANENSLPMAEVYHPATGVFALTGNLNAARSNHRAILLESGKVLITGGNANHSALSNAEIYDPEKGIFLSAGNMTAPREFHTATLLANGMVLITGGKTTGKPSAETTLSSAELYNPSLQKFTLVGNMTERRYSHAAILLTDGRISIMGGSRGRAWKDIIASAEIFDPQRKTFDKIAEMSLPRFNHQSATLRLSDGRILIAGAGARLEIFDPTSDSFHATLGNVGTGRIFSTATLFENGEVLITGGYNFDYPPTASAWLYSP